MKALRWKREPGMPGVQAPVSYGGSSHDYVISHWPGRHVVSYRPPGKHVPVGTFETEKEARAAAAAHAAAGSPVPKVPERFVPRASSRASRKPAKWRVGQKSARQMNREIASSLSASGQPDLASIFASPEARKEFAGVMRHELQKKELAEKGRANLAAYPFAVKRVMQQQMADGSTRDVREFVGNFPTLEAAIVKAEALGGWVTSRADDSVVYGTAREP